MSFETGGGMEDPLGDDGEDEDEDVDVSVDVDESTQRGEESRATVDEQSVDSSDREVSQDVESVPEFSELDPNENYYSSEIAEVLMDKRYHDEDPPIPYAMWRSGSSTGRRRMSVELNPEIDHLLEAAMAEFRNRYECKINKSDLREMALVYGLLNLDDGVFEIAEEWGLQYNG